MAKAKRRLVDKTHIHVIVLDHWYEDGQEILSCHKTEAGAKDRLLEAYQKGEAYPAEIDRPPTATIEEHELKE